MKTPIPKDPETAFGTNSPAAHSPVPIRPEDDPIGATELGLSSEEAAQFRTQGFVIKRGLIAREEFSPFLELFWSQPPILQAGAKQDDSTTWIAPGRFWPKENRWGLARNWMGDAAWPAAGKHRHGAAIGERVGRLPHKLTQDISNDVWRWHGIGHDPDFVNATSAHPNVMYMAEALMGGPVKRPHRNRGIYAIFPRDPRGPVSALGPHMDANMAEMQVVTLLEDVEPGGGGFTFYPGSAQSLYHTSQQALNWVATPESKKIMDIIKKNTVPVEFTGKAGDVVFCHGWIVHSAGVHEGKRIRLAAIQDLNRSRPRGHMRWTAAGKQGGPRINCDMDGVFRFTTDGPDNAADGMREVTNQWIMDSNEFVADRRAPDEDMFADWNLGKHAVQGNVIDETPWWDRYKLPLLPTGDVARGGGGTPAIALENIATYAGDGCWHVNLHANL